METIYLVASGDLRLSANQNCEAAQAEMERQLNTAFEIGGCFLPFRFFVALEKEYFFLGLEGVYDAFQASHCLLIAVQVRIARAHCFGQN